MDTAIHDAVEKVRSWIPRKLQPPPMSRDFWMPDRSCRVCYGCDSQFNLFNRRHHCRICGRVFCGNCTQNTLPASADGRSSLREDGWKVRVCNFCFKVMLEQDFVMPDVSKSLSPVLTPSSSSCSLASSTASGSSPASSSACPDPKFGVFGCKGPPTDGLELFSDATQQGRAPIRRRNSALLSSKERQQSPTAYQLCNNRSDDEDECKKDEDYCDSRIHMHSQCYEVDGSSFKVEPADSAQKSESSHGDGCIIKTTDTGDKVNGVEIDLVKHSGSPNIETGGTFPRRSAVFSDEYEGPDEAVEDSNFYSHLYKEQGMYGCPSQGGERPVDIVNNPWIWVPPSPEEEEDDVMISLADDDDGNEGSVWGSSCLSSSITSRECRSRSKTASHEQRQSMRAVVDGHFRALVAQLLNGEGIPTEDCDKESWLDIVTTLSLQAASLVKPDTSGGVGMDPGGYVKVKCIATGRCSESYVVKGVVCKKNVAHRRMMSRYKNPRLLLLGGALEYQRVSNQLSSIDTLLQQERDHLSMTVARIEAYHPNILLVEKTVSRYAQDRLLDNEISLVLNVKRPLLERIARCTGAKIVPTSDNLHAPKTGNCEYFHVERYVEEHCSVMGKKLTKTLMFFEGCPKPLGCTVLLKGSNSDELKKIKRVVQLAAFAAYHLALETSFLADEGARPDLTLKSPISVSLPTKQSNSDRSISTIPGFLVPASGRIHIKDSQAQIHRGQLDPQTDMPTSLHSPSITLNLNGSASKVPRDGPVVPVFTTPYVLSTVTSPGASPQNVGCQEDFVENSRFKPYEVDTKKSSLHEMNGSFFGITRPMSDCLVSNQECGISDLSVSSKKFPVKTLTISIPCIVSPATLSTYECPVLTAKHDCELSSMTTSLPSSDLLSFEKCQRAGVVNGGSVHLNSEENLSQESQLMLEVDNQDVIQCENLESNQEDFPPSPSDHQSILVSYSSSCLKKGTVCERGHLFRIKYYGSFDKPLGRFLQDDLFDSEKRCPFCGEPKDVHIHCYTHRQSSLTMSVQTQRKVLTGEKEGKVWMWHRCLKCSWDNGIPPATHRVVMSDAAWGLSFGKFLDLNFSNNAAASRVAACGHSLHRDCLRFYGFGSRVACFRYAPIIVHSVCLPPSKLDFNSLEEQDWLKNDANEVTDKGDLIFAEAFDALRQIGEKIVSYGSRKIPEVRRRIAELETLLQKEKTGFEEALRKAVPMKTQTGKLTVDILQLNRLRRALAVCSGQWEKRLSSLVSAMKLRKSATDYDLTAFDDPSISFTKDLISGRSSNSFSDFRGMHCNSLDLGNSTIQSQNMVDPVNGEGMPSSSICQPWDLSLQIMTGGDTYAPGDCNGPSNLISVKQLLDTSETYASREKLLVDCSLSEMEVSLLSKQTQLYTGRQDTENLLPLGLLEEKTNSGPLEKDIGMRRIVSEGQFPMLPDLSHTYDTAWTGKGQSIEAHMVNIGPNGQEIFSRATSPDIVVTGGNSTSGNNVIGTDALNGDSQEHSLKSAYGKSTFSQDRGITGLGSPLASTTTSPTKSAETFAELEGWVGAPFSSFQQDYGKGSQSSLMALPPRAESQGLYNSPSALCNAHQVAAGGARILLPMGINDTVVAVYDDEPTSIIAYAIVSHEYQAHLLDRSADRDKQKDKDREHKDKEREQKEKEEEEIEAGDSSRFNGILSHPLQFAEASLEQVEIYLKDRYNKFDETYLANSKDIVVTDPLIQCKAMHIRVSFTDDSSQEKMKYTVTCYYAKQFDALRKKCCSSDMAFIRSLCRCKKWRAQGGKSNVFFAKTSDDRFVIKQVTKTELESFIKFAPEYFKYLSDALNTGSPTCLAKILGIFQVTIKHAKGGKDVRMDLMAMENLLYGRHVTRVYDLKGSLRSRYNADATGVQLDQNLLESMLTNPIFIGNKAKRLLERAVWNDTSFLASVDVMDYSLLVGVDEGRQELVLGIIDFMRQYTWDKHLETWVKASGILGGPKNAAPTVISPQQYKKRFRKAMSSYFLMVPDQWSPPTLISGSALIEGTDDPSLVEIQDESVGDVMDSKL